MPKSLAEALYAHVWSAAIAMSAVPPCACVCVTRQLAEEAVPAV